MFPVDQLARFEAHSPNYRLLKPWWGVCTDYLAAGLLLLALLAGAFQATRDNFICLPAVDCDFGPNVSASVIRNGSLPTVLPSMTNTCSKYHSSGQESRMVVVLTKLPDRRQYDFVDSECGQKAIHWFMSFFPFIIFVQAVALVIIDNFWLKFPSTSSTLEHFLNLVMECYNSPGTSLAVSNTLWGTNITGDRHGTAAEDIAQESSDRKPLLNRSQSGTDSVKQSLPLGQSGSDTCTSSSLEVSEAMKAKTLYEKIKQFRKDIEKKRYCCTCQTLVIVYLLQAVLQFALSVSFIIFNGYHYMKFSSSVKCEIDDIISDNYKYFKCSHAIIPYYEATAVLFFLLIGPYTIICAFVCYWTGVKSRQKYEFVKVHRQELRVMCGNGAMVDDATVEIDSLNDDHEDPLQEIRDVKAAKGDLAFMLYLLDEYNKLYSYRFSVFLSQKNEKKLKYFILLKKWPLEKLQSITEDGGRTLKLNNLSGIPKSVFQMSELDSLIIENCTLTEDDFCLIEWQKLSLRSLSLIRCGLKSIPTAILLMDSLETLDVSYNKVDVIPSEISGLHNLHTLDIASNNVTEGVEHIFAMENLQVLNLRQNNFLQRLPDRIGESKLRKVYVSERIVDEMSEETKELFRAKDIHVTKTLSVRDVSVIQYLPHLAPNIERVRKNNQKVYKMTSKPKGLALIFNNMHYSDRRFVQRKGSEVDAERLEKLFDDMGYEVHPMQDVMTAEDFKNHLLDKVSSGNVAAKVDSVIVTVLSHGEKEDFVLGNGERFLVNELVEFVCNVDGYRGKPKLFFIQTCRGSRIIHADEEKIPDHELQSIHVPRQSNVMLPMVIHDGMYGAKDSEDDPCLTRSMSLDIPGSADVLISYSTLPGFVSWRNPSTGSWYIQALIDVFSKYAWEEDVLSLLTYVNYDVSRKYKTVHGYKQIPAPQSTLTKKMFFLPGYFEEE